MKSFFKTILLQHSYLLLVVTEKRRNQLQMKRSETQRLNKEPGHLQITLSTLLVLSEEQYASVYKINLDIAKKNSVNMQSNESKLSKFKANQKARDASFQEVLTADQFDLYKQKENELMDKIKQRAADMRN